VHFLYLVSWICFW